MLSRRSALKWAVRAAVTATALATIIKLLSKRRAAIKRFPKKPLHRTTK